MSNRIADFRKIRRMSLDDLSEASGLSKSTLSELERGMTRPMLDSARRIANALDAYEHEIWPEDATMPLTNRTVDDELAAAKEKLAYFEELAGERLVQISDDAERIAALEKALDQLHDAASEYQADQTTAVDPRCAVTQPVTVEDAEALNLALRNAAALLTKEPRNEEN